MIDAGGKSAIEQLQWHYTNRHAAAMDAHRAGVRVVGVTSQTVPVELIAAAGMFPLLLSPPENAPSEKSPHRQFMEDVFDARIRSIFDFLVSGEGQFLSSVIIPRTSEQEHKLFLYLKEIARQGHAPAMPEVRLFNLLHTQNDESRDYSLERTKELKQSLENLSGKPLDDTALRTVIAAGNKARAAARSLTALRMQQPTRLRGTDALALLGARWFMAADKYAALANQAIREIEAMPTLNVPRLLIKGYPLDRPLLHKEIESHGAVVVAEDDAWGSRSATPDISTDGDPLQAIIDHYYHHVASPRQFPLELAHKWFHDTCTHVDGVIFHLPPDDDLHGWDYPRHRDHLDRLGIPHMLIRTADSHSQIAPFIATLKAKRES